MSDISAESACSDEEIQRLRAAIKLRKAENKQKLVKLKKLDEAQNTNTGANCSSGKNDHHDAISESNKRPTLPKEPFKVDILLIDGGLQYDLETQRDSFLLKVFMKAGTGLLKFRSSNFHADLLTEAMTEVAYAGNSFQFAISSEHIRFTKPNTASGGLHEVTSEFFVTLAKGGKFIVDIANERVAQAFFQEITDPSPKSQDIAPSLQSSVHDNYLGPWQYLDHLDNLLNAETSAQRSAHEKTFNRNVDFTFNNDRTVVNLKRGFGSDFIQLDPGQQFTFSDQNNPDGPALLCHMSEGQCQAYEKDGMLSLDVLSSKGFQSIQSTEATPHPYCMKAVWNEEPTRRILEGMNRLQDVYGAPGTIFPFQAMIEGKAPKLTPDDYIFDQIVSEELSGDTIFGIPLDQDKRAHLESAIGYHKALKVIPFQGLPGTGKTLTQIAMINWIFNTKSDLGKGMQPVLATGPTQQSLNVIQKRCKSYIIDHTMVALDKIDFSSRTCLSGLDADASTSIPSPVTEKHAINIVRFPNSNVRKEDWLRLRTLAAEGDLTGIHKESDNFTAFSYLVARYLSRKSSILELRAACSNWVKNVGRAPNSPPLTAEERERFLADEKAVDIEALKRIDVLIIAPGMIESHRFYDDFQPKAVMMNDAAQMHEWSALGVETKFPRATVYMLFGAENLLGPSSVARLGQLRMSQFKRMMRVGWPSFRTTKQYKMHPTISKLVSGVFFDDELIDGPNCRKLGADAYVSDWITMATNIRRTDGGKLNGDSDRCIFINTGTNHEKGTGRNITNFTNALAIHGLLGRFARDKRLPNHINFGIVAMYKTQVKELNHHLFGLKSQLPSWFRSRVTVATPELFRGDESEVVIIDFVRSNTASNIGYLDQFSSLCIALSRARCLNVAVGDYSLLKTYKTPEKSRYSQNVALEAVMKFLGWKLVELGQSSQQPHVAVGTTRDAVIPRLPPAAPTPHPPPNKRRGRGRESTR